MGQACIGKRFLPALDPARSVTICAIAQEVVIGTLAMTLVR